MIKILHDLLHDFLNCGSIVYRGSYMILIISSIMAWSHINNGAVVSGTSNMSQMTHRIQVVAV